MFFDVIHAEIMRAGADLIPRERTQKGGPATIIGLSLSLMPAPR